MIFISSRFEELADKNASFSKSNYRFIDMPESCLAGAIISSKKYPPTSDALVKKHVEDGSIFVALLDKYSIQENAVENLLELHAKNKVAVYLGTVVHKNGYVKIEDFVDMPEREYAITKCNLTAVGVNLFECPVYCLDVLFEKMEQHIESTAPMEVYPAYMDYRIIDDWRLMIAGLPLIGFEKANTLYQKYGDVDVIDVIRDLTNPDKNTTGFGRVVCERLRDFFGVPDGFNLGLVWDEEKDE